MPDGNSGANNKSKDQQSNSTSSSWFPDWATQRFVLVKGRIQKKLTTATDLVNMVLSPFTPLPPMGLVNKIIVKVCDLFNPPISCQDREY